MAFSNLLAWLSGANGAAGQAGSYYDTAYNQAVGTGSGSLASTFGGEEKAALQPAFQAQDQQLAGKEASMGITNSGAAKADFGNLASNQSSTIAGALAPFYQQAESIGGNILAQKPGAQNQAYNQANQQFMQAASDAAAAAGGIPPVPGQGQQQQPDYFDNGTPVFTDQGPGYDAQGAPVDYNSPFQPNVTPGVSQLPGPSFNPYSVTIGGGGGYGPQP